MRFRASVSTLLFANLLTIGTVQASAHTCFNDSQHSFSEVLACYKKEQDALPLVYTPIDTSLFPGVEKRSFNLTSQQWSPQGQVTPEQWQHNVDIYIPDNAAQGQALLLANNGTPYAKEETGVASPTDFTQDMALNIARSTGTIVISVSNIPNQYLTWTDDAIARKEDPAVAHSWRLFLDAPFERPFVSLRLPMVVSMVKAMDLAHRELTPWGIERFIASGVSKRGWATWLSAIVDERVHAIVPFVIDVVNMDQVLEHTYRSYAQAWPLAFSAYHQEGITREIKTENFARLMRIEDPLRYLDTAYASRLEITKYVVNASGDDFFLPDNTKFFYDRLPDQKALRVAPNASHYGIKHFVESSLIPAVNRLQKSKPLPGINVSPTPGRSDTLQLEFSEAPVQVKQWTAVNPDTRDFRYHCGIRYKSSELNMTNSQMAEFQLTTPEHGWSATFVEATFSDGFVATTQVQVLPMDYPRLVSAGSGKTCRTLSDEGSAKSTRPTAK